MGVVECFLGDLGTWGFGDLQMGRERGGGGARQAYTLMNSEISKRIDKGDRYICLSNEELVYLRRDLTPRMLGDKYFFIDSAIWPF